MMALPSRMRTADAPMAQSHSSPRGGSTTWRRTVERDGQRRQVAVDIVDIG